MNKTFKNILGSIINNYSPFGKFLKKMGLGTDLASAMENVLKYYTHSGMTNDKREEMAAEDEYLDENREQDYEITKRGWEEMYSPEATLKSQAAGLDAVGINRMALAGNVTSGASASTPSPSQPSASGSSGDPISALMSIIGGAAQVKDLGAAAALKRSQTEAQNIENRWAERMNAIDYQNKVFQSQVILANVRKLNADAEYSEWAALYAPDMFQSKIDEQNSNAALAMARYDEAYSEVAVNEARVKEIEELCKNHQKERQEMDSKIALMREQIQLTIEQRDLTHEQIEVAKQTAKKLEEEIKLLGKQIGLADKDLQYYIMNHIRVLSTDSTDSGFGVNATIINPQNGSIERRHGGSSVRKSGVIKIPGVN